MPLTKLGMPFVYLAETAAVAAKGDQLTESEPTIFGSPPDASWMGTTTGGRWSADRLAGGQPDGSVGCGAYRLFLGRGCDSGGSNGAAPRCPVADTARSDPRLLRGVKPLPIQAFVPKAAVEALAHPVLQLSIEPYLTSAEIPLGEANWLTKPSIIVLPNPVARAAPNPLLPVVSNVDRSRLTFRCAFGCSCTSGKSTSLCSCSTSPVSAASRSWRAAARGDQ